ncbi:MAG: Zn-dependent hydrolase [Hyphomicrobiaceae bacterium]
MAHDVQDLLDRLSRFGGRTDGGVDRPAFSPIYEEAVRWLTAEMQARGLAVRRDQAGNVIGRLGPADAPAVVIGSHIDTVPSGGRFDGALGVMAGLAVAKRMAPRIAEAKRALEVVAFADEEGTFGLTFGSRAMTGSLTAAELAGARNRTGLKLTEALQAIGCDPARIGEARRSGAEIAAYLELHIEQGPVLESAGLDIGAVEAIVGIDIVEIVLEGEANHSGTTPMEVRRDALKVAAEAMTACHAARRGATTLNFGSLTVAPGAINIVPARVTLTQEIRSADASEILALKQRCAEIFKEASVRSGVTLTTRQVSIDPPALMDPALASMVERQADRLGLTHRRMPSGAGHDAQCLAELAPAVMIFVPSIGGISHNPKELSTPEQCAKGCDVLAAVAETLLFGA